MLDDPPDALRQAVELPGYAARVERVMAVAIAGFDWNCEQHITPRWSATDLAPLLEELQRLRTQVAAG